MSNPEINSEKPGGTRNWKEILPTALLVVVVVFVLVKWGTYFFETGPDLDGKPAPEIIYRTESGMGSSISEKKGGALLLVFWASWCSNCIHEMPQIRTIENHYGPQGLTVLAFNVDESAGDVQGKFKAQDWPRNLIFSFQKSALGPYGVNSLPMSIIINKKGIVTKVMIGSQNWMSFEIKSLIEKALSD